MGWGTTCFRAVDRTSRTGQDARKCPDSVRVLEAAKQPGDMVEALGMRTEVLRQGESDHVPPDDLWVSKVEAGRVGSSREHRTRIREVVQVVRRASAVHDREARVVAATSPSDPLRVVEGLRWHVPQEHGIEVAQVDADLEGGGTAEDVDGAALEVALEFPCLVRIELSGVFFDTQRARKPLLVQPAVVVVIQLSRVDRFNAAAAAVPRAHATHAAVLKPVACSNW